MKSVLSGRPDVFFLTYDEPLKDLYWQNLKKLVGWAKRVDGIKGFDAAHKACAESAKSSRFFIIDGDNSVDSGFLRAPARPPLFFKTHSVMSWPARNSVNGLVYGNGGIKNWSRETILKMKSHENAEKDSMAVDFCFDITYVGQSKSLSSADINQTPFQAFRSGFREGVKMALVEGEPLSVTDENLAETFHRRMARSNLNRLKIWCSVGADVPNGLWAIYGARKGCQMLFSPEWDFKLIHDYDWFQQFWQNQIAPEFTGFQEQCQITGYRWNSSKLALECENLGLQIESTLNLPLRLFSPKDSEFFKSVYVNRLRGAGSWK